MRKLLFTASFAACAAGVFAGQGVWLDAQPVSRFVLASVSDGDGQPVLGLSAEDFIVRDDGGPCETINATPAAYPVAVLVDTTQAARDEFLKMRTAVRRFVDRLSGREVALYTFGDRALRMVDFTRDAAKLHRAIDGLFAAPGAESHVLDAIIEASKDIKRRESPITLIAVISAGANDQSNRTPKEVFDAVLSSRSTIHVVEMRTPRASGRLNNVRGLRRMTSDRAAEAALGLEELLRELASRTRGDYNLIFAGSGYQSDLDALQRMLESEVIIEYGSASTSGAALRIGARKVGAVVRAVGIERAPAAR